MNPCTASRNVGCDFADRAGQRDEAFCLTGEQLTEAKDQLNKAIEDP